jgi:hypothetical protein
LAQHAQADAVDGVGNQSSDFVEFRVQSFSTGHAESVHYFANFGGSFFVVP